jgi:DNA replication and repair protein RecF
VLAGIEIENFRCIERAQLEFDPAGTGIVGANASGKTSLLESIFFLSHGRSFRGGTREKLLKQDTRFFRIVGQIEHSRGSFTAGVEYSNDQLSARLAGHGISGVSDIAEVLPTQIIDPGVHRLVEEGSARRRRLLDWGVFHVKHQFLHVWRRYQRALHQRNAALRAAEDPSVIQAWETELVASGIVLDQDRQAYIETLQAHFARIAGRLLGVEAGLAYRRGWPADVGLQPAFELARARDLRLKTTTVGAHRADLTFRVAGDAARDRVSRGQQKMLAAAVILAQIALRSTLDAEPVCLLLDDPAAELDVDNLGRLLAVIDELPAQIIATSVTDAGLRGMRIGRLFHVEQGRFGAML